MLKGDSELTTADMKNKFGKKLSIITVHMSNANYANLHISAVTLDNISSDFMVTSLYI